MEVPTMYPGENGLISKDSKMRFDRCSPYIIADKGGEIG
jgi:hypothetical protein